MPTILYSPRRWNAALIHALTERAVEAGTTVESGNAADAEWRLLEDQADAALISPIAFALRTAELRLLPGACVCCLGSTGDVQLRFRPGLDEIGSVGYAGEEDIDVLLARLVLIEKYGQKPVFRQVPAVGDGVPDGLDAVLLRDAATAADTLDVVGEWFDLTELPYVREVLGLQRMRGGSGVGALLDELSRAAGAAADQQALAAVEHLLLDGEVREGQTDIIPPHHRFLFDDDAAEGLSAFFRLAFYHGLHRDIPVITLWGADDPAIDVESAG